jgi:hypothetical protein
MEMPSVILYRVKKKISIPFLNLLFKHENVTAPYPLRRVKGCGVFLLFFAWVPRNRLKKEVPRLCG